MEPSTTPPPPASASAAASVLGNDDLLRGIFLRLDFPTYLARAAAVCRHWLRHASYPAFLSRFRELHPPRLLGFYIVTYCNGPFPRFVPLPQPPELAAVIRRSSFELGGHEGVMDCRDGRLIVSVSGRSSVRSPLHPGRGSIALPELLLPAVSGYSIVCFRQVADNILTAVHNQLVLQLG
ncbi:unnamed protein product [Urochloa humidicola]